MSDRDDEQLETKGNTTEPADDPVFPSEILEHIPVDKREEFSRNLVSFGLRVTRKEVYGSSLPSHKEAAGWNALVPGTAEKIFNRYEQLEIKKLEASDRVLDIAEEKFRNDSALERKQHDDFVTMAKTEIKNSAVRVSRGQWFAFLAFIVVSLGGFYMVQLGHDALGIAILVFEAVGVAGVFLNQMRRESKRLSAVNVARNAPSSDSDS